jgi:hypothetical protein
MITMRGFTMVAALAVAAGCAAAADGQVEHTDAAESPATVQHGTFGVTVHTWAELSAGDDVTFTGRASRNLREVFSFVPDDAFGTAEADRRDFRLTLARGHEANTLLSGLPILLRVQPQSGTPDTFFVQVVGAPRVRRGSGSSQVFVAADVVPVYLVDSAGAKLAYRATTTAPAAATGVTFQVGSATLSAVRTASGWSVDFTYEQLTAALRLPLVVTATAPGRSYAKTVELGVTLRSLDITTEDPYDHWPRQACGEAAHACVAADPVDLGGCGRYREVQACVFQVECERTFGAVETQDAAVAAAQADFNARAQTGGQWARIAGTRVFDLQGCGDFSLASVVDLFAAEQGAPEFAQGRVLTSTATPFTTTTYSPAGPAVLDAANAFGAQTNPLVWHYARDNGSCHNCTEFDDRVILLYPGTWRVVVLDGIHGYDS